jgi:alpha-N-arabinofuranosidase
MTEPGGRVWKQTTYHPFALTSENAKGQVLRLAIDSPQHETQQFGNVTTIDATATHNPESGEVTIFVVNRSADSEVSLEVALHAFDGLQLSDAITYANDDPYWQATVEDSTSVLPAPNESAALADGKLTATLPPVSWSMIKLARA